MMLTGQNTQHILKYIYICSYAIETYTATYLATGTVACTFHCTTLCITWAGLGYRYDTMCLLLKIVINEDTRNMHQILTWHCKTCNIVLVSRNWLHLQLFTVFYILTRLWYYYDLLYFIAINVLYFVMLEILVWLSEDSGWLLKHVGEYLVLLHMCCMCRSLVL
jgi:hypothetical protein